MSEAGHPVIDTLSDLDERILVTTDPRWVAHSHDHFNHDKIHTLEHAHEQELSRNAEKRLEERNVAHAKEHEAEEEAINKALVEVDKLAVLHATAHAREHLAHEQRHEDARVAVSKADTALDKRLESLNGVYGQMREAQKTYASTERFDALAVEVDRRFADTTKHIDERAESNRARIEALEKGDVRSEGKGLGQTAVLGAIVTAIVIAGIIIGIVVNLGRLP